MKLHLPTIVQRPRAMPSTFCCRTIVHPGCGCRIWHFLLMGRQARLLMSRAWLMLRSLLLKHFEKEVTRVQFFEVNFINWLKISQIIISDGLNALIVCQLWWRKTTKLKSRKITTPPHWCYAPQQPATMHEIFNALCKRRERELQRVSWWCPG